MTAGSLRSVGVDGGATRTRYVFLDEEGHAVARSEGVGSLLGVGDDEGVANRLFRSVEALVGSAGGSLPVGLFGAGLAGAGRSDLRSHLTRRLETMGIADTVMVATDAEVAFFHAFGDGPGILLIAGTGSNALGRGADGTIHRIGGWGSLLGDEGSGFRIGLDGLRAAIRGMEGRGPETGFLEAILRTAGVDSPEELLKWGPGIPKARVAALGHDVVRAAFEGNAIAESIVSDAVEGLLDHVRALRERVGEPLPEVALVGGLVDPGAPLHARVAEALAAEGVTVHPRLVDGAVGAARLAARGGGDSDDGFPPPAAPP